MNKQGLALIFYGLSLISISVQFMRLPGHMLNRHDWLQDRAVAYDKAHPCPPPAPAKPAPAGEAFIILGESCRRFSESSLIKIAGYEKITGEPNDTCIDICLKHGDTRLVPCERPK